MGTLEVTTGSGEKFGGYMAAPKGTPKGGIVVVQEIYGVNREVRRVVDQCASEGYLAFAPDLLWRVKPGLDFDYEDRDGARDAITALDQGKIVEDILDAIKAIQGKLGGKGPIGMVALGWGGKFGLTAAGKSDVAAVVAYYPGNLPGAEAITRDVKAPMMYHFAFHDTRTKPDFRESLRKTLAGRDDVEIYVYPDADHGFANHDRSEFHADSAKLADERSFGFLGRVLARAAS